jgi:hypothetical protein
MAGKKILSSGLNRIMSIFVAICMKTPKAVFVLLVAFYFPFCHSSSADQRVYGKDTVVIDASHPNLPPPKRNPEFRSLVKKEPVAEYREKTGRLEGEFVVRLYQTSKNMAFRIDMEYEGLPGDDTVRLPDLGSEPKPILRQGGEKLSCIIGFTDNDNQFRELKLVHANGNQLKITTLKHWVVTDHFKLVSQ